MFVQDNIIMDIFFFFFSFHVLIIKKLIFYICWLLLILVYSFFSVVLSLFLLILIIVLYIICYHTRQKGDYETKEAKGADLADNPDMAVMYNQDGHPIPKRKEWFVWEHEGFLPPPPLSHHRPWEQFLSNCFYSLFCPTSHHQSQMEHVISTFMK